MNKILILDADQSHARAISLYLERQEYDVRFASSGKEAVALFEGHPFDVVLADPLYEGNLQGIEQLAKFRSARPLTHYILYSPEELWPVIMDRMGTESTAYLNKPLSSIALDVALQQSREWISMKGKLERYSEKLASLHTAQNLYQQLFDEVPCYISVQDRDFRITATNRLFKEDFGTQIGAHCYEIYKHRTTECPNCPVASTFADGMPHQTEEVVTSKSGRQYNVLTWTAPIRDEKGIINQVMEMSTNITQIRQLQDHLTSLGLMLGSMSHGVKGMLTALDGGIYQLESGLKKKDEARIEQAFGQVRDMADRIRKMVLEILYYAKSRELQYQQVDAHRLARSVVETVFPMAEQNSVPLKVDIDPSLGLCDADPGWLQAALVNILENAVEACRHDRMKKDHQVWFQARPRDADRICFEITDNGMGMDRETQEKMFTLFFSSKGSRGTGLGMFIAHHVVSQHGGKIEVTSSPGEGTRFLVSLPRHRVEGERSVKPPASLALRSTT